MENPIARAKKVPLFVPVGLAPSKPSALSFFSLDDALSVFPGAFSRGQLQSPDLVQQLVGLLLLLADVPQLEKFNQAHKWRGLDFIELECCYMYNTKELYGPPITPV
jgi:hypothetical protein